MNRGITGSYYVTAVSGEKVAAFIPNQLPPDPPLVLDVQRQKKLEQAMLAMGRLDAITTLLPDPSLFLYAYVRREAVLSSQIEGTQSSLSDLLLYELDQAQGVPFDDVKEVSNYVAALEHGMARLADGFPLCNRLIREIHHKLLEDSRGGDKQPGEFRRSQNWLGGTRPGNALFVPPPPHEVENCMQQLEKFIHDDAFSSSLIKAALAHVQFETIHPFLDGNGRVGRLLIALLLHHEQILKQPILYLSLFFKRHRSEYYRLLNQVRTVGDWEAWLDFFLEGVIVTAASAVQTANRLLALFKEDELKIQKNNGHVANILRVFTVLQQSPLMEIGALSKKIGISYPTVARAVKDLVADNILEEITGRKRGKVFVYRRYLDILNEGTNQE